MIDKPGKLFLQSAIVMSVRRMVCTALFLLLGMSCAYAQQGNKYFVYIQSENKQPFYVRANGNLISGSTAGYIIIPQLKEGVNNIVVGFPKNEYPEQHYYVKLGGNKNQGYLLQHTGEDKFVLYNLQDYQVIQPVAASSSVSPPPVSPPVTDAANTPPVVVPAATPADTAAVKTGDTVAANIPSRDTAAIIPVKEKPKDTNPFADMLDKVAGHAKPAATATQPPVSANPTPPQADSGAITGKPVAVQQTAPVTPDNMATLTPVDSGQGQHQDFADDTTTIAIPKLQRKSRRQEHADQPQFITFLPGADSTAAGTGSRAVPAVKDTADNNVPVAEEGSSATATVMINSDCKVVADEKEFQKIRRKIAMQKDDENMLRAADKYFAATCFSTAQIRSIAYLFMADEYRYKFLDMAYGRTQDPDNFFRLEKVLSDQYYIGRFRAMIKK